MTEVNDLNATLLSGENRSIKDCLIELDVEKMRKDVTAILNDYSIGDVVNGIVQGHRTILIGNSIKASCNRNSEGKLDGHFDTFDEIGNIEYSGEFVNDTVTVLKSYASPLGIYMYSEAFIKDSLSIS